MKISDSTCSIHGVNYIVSSKRSKGVRIFWIFTFILSLCGFGYYAQNSYYKYFVMPDITARIREKNVNDFPRPAVTICPRMVAIHDLADLDNILEDSKARNKSECEYLLANSHWCSNDETLQNLQSYCADWYDDLDDLNVIEQVNKSAHSTKEIFQKGKSALRIFTHQGICYTTNIQDFEIIFNKDVIHSDFQSYRNYDHPKLEWTLDDGYFTKASSYPERSYSHTAFDIPLNLTKKDAENACNSRSMYAFIHLPSEIPTEYHKFLPIRYGSKSSIIVTTKSYRSDESLRAYSPNVRKCYFLGEKKLTFFNTYSKAQCQLECVAYDVLKTCMCVPFWYPRKQTTPVCELSKLKCAQAISVRYRILGKPSCKCYPLCNIIRYDVESTPNNFYYSVMPK